MNNKAKSIDVAVVAISPEALESGDGSSTAVSETRSRLEKLKEEYGATWDGPDDPNDPYNWSSLRKNTVGIIYSVGGLVTLMSASMIAPALVPIAHDLNIDQFTAQLIFSIYFLGMGFGPFVIAALSEMHGRKNVWIYSQLFYIVWSVLSPVGNNKWLMIMGRLMAAIGGSSSITITGPVMADIFNKANRGKSLAIAFFLPFLGPALGPVLGGVVTELVGWQWIFWTMSIINAVLTVVGVILLHESYTPAILRRKAARSKASSGKANGILQPRGAKESFWSRLRTGLGRPINLLLYRPTIQLLSFALGINFGIYSLLLSTLATLYIGPKYNQNTLQASLHYIAISIGATVENQLGTILMDWIYNRLTKRSNRNGTAKSGVPEYRVPYMAPGLLLVAIGSFWYGWSAEKCMHWAMVDVGVGIFAAGSFIFGQGLMAYQLDDFRQYAASAGAASRFPCYIAGFTFPIFAPKLYEALGYGWGNTALASAWIALGFPIPVVLWVWGAKLRGVAWGGQKLDL